MNNLYSMWEKGKVIDMNSSLSNEKNGVNSYLKLTFKPQEWVKSSILNKGMYLSPSQSSYTLSVKQLITDELLEYLWGQGIMLSTVCVFLREFFTTS